jgi:surfactin synthase thioesterase subunit
VAVGDAPAGRPWLSRIGLARPDRPVIVVFPHAGSGASAYQRWRSAAPDDVELFAVQSPGRDTRRREALVTDVGDLTGPLSETLREVAGERPFTFFGHSVGTLVAFELTRSLRQAGRRGPLALGLSGFPAPHLPIPDLHRLPDAEILAFLRDHMYLPERLAVQKGFMEIFLPVLKADFALAAGYRPRTEAPLTCPMYLFGGASDPFATETELDAWRRYGAAQFSLTMLPGDHFYLFNHGTKILNALAEPLRSVTQ